MSKTKAYGKVAGLLNTIQGRLTTVSDRLESLEKIAATVANVNRNVETQSAVNKQVTDALYNLRESTQKSFNAVSSDVATLLKSIQKLNERLGEIESNALLARQEAQAATNTAHAAFQHMTGIETRVKVLEDIVKFVKSLFSSMSKIS